MHLYFKVRYTNAAATNAWQLIQMMQADSPVTDVRWMAYMLATAFWRHPTPSPRPVQVPKLGKGKKAGGGAGQEAADGRQAHQGVGGDGADRRIAVANKRRYKAPVKIKKIESDDVVLLAKLSKIFQSASVLGGAWIVEKDGDQFVISATGTEVWHSKRKPPSARHSPVAHRHHTTFMATSTFTLGAATCN